MNAPRIFHLIPNHHVYGETIQGISAYAHDHTEWILPQTWYYDWAHREDIFQRLCHEKPDACIAFIDDETMLKLLIDLDIPVVDILWAIDQHPFPVCTEDYQQSGQAAANHLLMRGFHHLAMRRSKKPHHHLQRLQTGFIEEATRHHAKVNLSTSGPDLLDFLNHKLPSSAFFITAQSQLINTLNRLKYMNLSSPHDIGILGYGELDPHQQAHVGISTVKRPTFSIGYNAARLLHAQLKGGANPSQTMLIPPESIQEDQSTNVLSIQDPELKHALEIINQQFKQPVNIEDIAKSTNVSRRTLDRHFKARLKISPQKLLENKRINHVRTLLISSDFPISLIATHAGYNSPVYMTNVFKKYTKMTPREYRKHYKCR